MYWTGCCCKLSKFQYNVSFWNRNVTEATFNISFSSYFLLNEKVCKESRKNEASARSKILKNYSCIIIFKLYSCLLCNSLQSHISTWNSGLLCKNSNQNFIIHKLFIFLMCSWTASGFTASPDLAIFSGLRSFTVAQKFIVFLKIVCCLLNIFDYHCTIAQRPPNFPCRHTLLFLLFVWHNESLFCSTCHFLFKHTMQVR